MFFFEKFKEFEEHFLGGTFDYTIKILFENF